MAKLRERNLRLHMRNLRLVAYVNAGMAFPLCCSTSRLLDTEKSRWPTTGHNKEVTCKNCLRVMRSLMKRGVADFLGIEK